MVHSWFIPLPFCLLSAFLLLLLLYEQISDQLSVRSQTCANYICVRVGFPYYYPHAHTRAHTQTHTQGYIFCLFIDWGLLFNLKVCKDKLLNLLHPLFCTNFNFSICPFICLSRHQFMRPIHPLLCLVAHPSPIGPSVLPFIHSCIHPSIHLSFHLPIHPSILPSIFKASSNKLTLNTIHVTTLVKLTPGSPSQHLRKLLCLCLRTNRSQPC